MLSPVINARGLWGRCEVHRMLDADGLPIPPHPHRVRQILNLPSLPTPPKPQISFSSFPDAPEFQEVCYCVWNPAASTRSINPLLLAGGSELYRCLFLTSVTVAHSLFRENLVMRPGLRSCQLAPEQVGDLCELSFSKNQNP